MAPGRHSLGIAGSLIDPSRRRINVAEKKLPWAIAPAIGVAIFWGIGFVIYVLLK